MKMTTLKEYAKGNNVSYEAVRQQVKRYRKELDGHIVKDGRQQLLDEEAVVFLDSKRVKNPVAVIQIEKDDRIRELEDQIKALLIEGRAQDKKIAQLMEWKADNAMLIAAADQTKLALTAAEASREEYREQADRASQEAAEAKAESAMLLAAAEQTKLALAAAEASREEYREQADRASQEAAAAALALREMQEKLKEVEEEKEALAAENKALWDRSWLERLVNRRKK